MDETELIDGVIFDQSASHAAGGVDRVDKAKIAFIQFCLSAPKTDVISSSLCALIFLFWGSFVCFCLFCDLFEFSPFVMVVIV